MWLIANIAVVWCLTNAWPHCRLHSLYLSGSQGAASHRLAQPGHESSHLVTSVLLERCGDSAVRHSNRIIPVIQVTLGKCQ